MLNKKERIEKVLQRGKTKLSLWEKSNREYVRLIQECEESINSLDKDSLHWKAVLNFVGPKVYILKCNEFFKIGRTERSVMSRIKDMQVGNPYEVELVFCIPTRNPTLLEEKIHEMFKASRRSGEWFRLYKEDFEALEGWLPNFFEEMRKVGS